MSGSPEQATEYTIPEVVIPTLVVEAYNQFVLAMPSDNSLERDDNKDGDKLNHKERLEHMKAGDEIGQAAFLAMFNKFKVRLMADKESPIENPTEGQVIDALSERFVNGALWYRRNDMSGV